jgi:hypothetical protein
MEYGWRVTKYDPRFRDSTGAYRGDTWTDVSDIGQVVGDVHVTRELYLAAESRYVAAALHFLKESGLTALRITGLELWTREKSSRRKPKLAIPSHRVPVKEGQYLSGGSLEAVCCLNLRSLMWCKLEEPGRFYLHFGYDYYMYIGTDKPLSASVAYARNLGLFVEPMRSPLGAD